MKKKAQIQQLPGLVIALVAIGLTLVIAFLIMSNVKANSTVAADGNATAAISDVQDATAVIPGWLNIIVITVVGALLIGLVALFNRRE